ncbi:isopentenyl-diphosphate delta-isomerase [Cribrihabitans marinus]|uniref:Isopentenyl-diphosphate Delta-isomerase n=1 Tax=Cribrihabitans marinus TaxID=1227549 RepID=A0A1H6Y0H2_9RHOB|nr:isopentenyl-diphosphate delta-isomerase [Cribrihabitans marinus]
MSGRDAPRLRQGEIVEVGIKIPAWVDGDLVPVDKLEAHERGLKHKAVSVFAVRGLDILIQRRAMGKYHTPGLWANTCCTHPDWNEPASTCAVRRLREELGITGLYPEYRHRLEYHADVGNGMIENEVVDVFLAHVRGDLDVAPDPAEVMDTRWIAYHDLLAEVERHPERFTPWLKIYLKNHSDTIFGPDLIISAKA